MRKEVFYLIVLLLFLTSVDALAITPAQSRVGFTPDLTKTVGFTIVNSEKRDLNIVVAVQGEMRDYVQINQPNFLMKADEESREIQYTLKLPHELPPGLHTAEIVVLQLPQEGSFDVTYVGAALAVLHEAFVDVPYPGKYIESKLDIKNDKEGNYIFTMPLKSRGSFDINDAGAKIDIFCPSEGNVVASLGTDHVSLYPDERKDISAVWTPNINSGECKAIGTVIFDDEPPLRFEKIFNVGGKALSLDTIKVSDFTLGEIAKFNAELRNSAQMTAENAHLILEIYSDDGNVLARVESPTQDIEPQQRTEMPLYWDTKGVTEKTFDATIFLNSDLGNDEIDIEMVVSRNDISLVGTGFVIAKPSQKRDSGSSTLMIVLIFLIVFLILINLSWFLFLRKRLK